MKHRGQVVQHKNLHINAQQLSCCEPLSTHHLNSTIEYLQKSISFVNRQLKIVTISIMQSTCGQNQGQVFKFPLSNEGIQSFTSVKQMKQTYIDLFDKIYGNSKTVKWTFYFIRSKFWKEINGKYKEKMEQIWKMRCNVCSSIIVYGKRQGFQEYYLLKINYYHMHATDITKYLSHLKNHDKFRYVVARLDTKHFSVKSSSEASIIEFISNLPTNLHKTTMYWVVKKYFSISQKYFFQLLRKINKKYEISFRKLVEKLNSKGYSVRYLPKDLLKEQKGKGNEHREPEQVRNKINPHLPNVLIIVSPQMKEEYQAFGQWVGFDLTFSVVRQRTQQNGQYMLGIFGGSNHSKKILSFGLVVTNSQSSFAYSYLFKQFFEIMNSVPDIIITDEQKAIFYSLKQLKQQGIFTGHHLFDMFHMLRKFRKRSYDSQTFQLIRKLIHAKDRFQYRSILKVLKTQLVNDKELDLIRNFDLNSEQYCYSQIPPKFTGIGISNNVNQFFHSLIKNEIRVATKLTHAIQIVLDLIERRNEASHKPIVTQHSIEGFLNMPFMKHFKSSISEKAYAYIFKEVSQGPTLKILTLEEEMTLNFLLSNEKTLKQMHFLTRNRFYVQSEFGIYLVYYKQNEYLRQTKSGKYDNGRWHCSCEHSQRCGYPCSHLSRILVSLNLNFLPYIHKRWILDPSAVLAHLEDGESNLKLKRPYEQIIHSQKLQGGKIDHYDIDGFKKCKKKQEKSDETQSKVKLAHLGSIHDKQTRMTNEQSEDASQESDSMYDEEESIVSKEQSMINLVESSEHQDQKDRVKILAQKFLEGYRAGKFANLKSQKPQERDVKIKKSGKGKPVLNVKIQK